MPIFFPQNDAQHSDKASIAVSARHRTLCLTLVLIALCIPNAGHTQSLARPGWAGSGLAPESWYQRAVFYRIDTPTDIPSRAQLPSLQAFGIDAILLTAADLPVAAPASTAAGAPDANDAPLTLDDLLFECSRLHIRVLVPLGVTENSSSVLALAKSWLYRGAAGFVLTSPGTPLNATQATPTPAADRNDSSVHAIHLGKTAPDTPIVAALHTLLASFPGNRILIADGAPLTTSFQLQIAPLSISATAPQPPARALLASASGQPLTPIEAARLLATPYPALLESASLPPALLARVFPPLSTPAEPAPAPAPAPPPPPSNVYGTYKPYVPKDMKAERRAEAAEKKAEEEADRIAEDAFPVQPLYEAIGATPEAQAAFYHRLVQLHRAKTSRAGSDVRPIAIAAPAFVWSITHPGVAPIFVVCNTSGTAQRIDLLTRQYLRTLLHTAAASGVVNTNSITVGAQGVYVGQAIGRE